MISLCTVGAAAGRPEDGGKLSPPQARGDYIPSIPDLSALSLLTSARIALHNIDTAPSTTDRDAAFDNAFESLVGLYQLHGCAWALDPLRQLYARAECPQFYIGYSADGRVRMRVSRMDLKNPAFADYTFLLVTLESHTGTTITSQHSGTLKICRRDGTTLTAERIDKQHPLWPNLKNMSEGFSAPSKLPPHFGISFKQVYAVKTIAPGSIDSLSLDWGDYGLSIPVSLWLGD